MLGDINLDIKRGEFVSIVGASGCGKSTLLKTITSLEDLTSGEILIEGKSINEPSDISSESTWMERSSHQKNRLQTGPLRPFKML